MMDKKFKRKWLKALRSRKYKQAKGVLYNGEGYCCLGVACKIAGLETDDRNRFKYDGNIYDTSLPAGLREELGITSEEQTRLIAMNDGGWDTFTHRNLKERKFGKIAKWIEEYL